MATETQCQSARENRSDAERISSYLLTRCSTAVRETARLEFIHCRVGCEKPVSGNLRRNFRIENEKQPRGRGRRTKERTCGDGTTSKNQAQAKSAVTARSTGKAFARHPALEWHPRTSGKNWPGPLGFVWCLDKITLEDEHGIGCASADPHRHKADRPGPRRAPRQRYDKLSRLAAEGYIIRKRTRAAMPSASPIPERLTPFAI